MNFSTQALAEKGVKGVACATVWISCAVVAVSLGKSDVMLAAIAGSWIIGCLF
jgi:hypothetical protein